MKENIYEFVSKICEQVVTNLSCYIEVENKNNINDIYIIVFDILFKMLEEYNNDNINLDNVDEEKFTEITSIFKNSSWEIRERIYNIVKNISNE